MKCSYVKSFPATPVPVFSSFAAPKFDEITTTQVFPNKDDIIAQSRTTNITILDYAVTCR